MMVADETPLEQLDELYRYLTQWANSQEKRLALKEESLNERAKRLDERELSLKKLEAKLTGNGT